MNQLPAELYKVKQIRELERTAMEDFNISEDTLMERAGRAAYVAMLSHFDDADSIIVVCGHGNNGGDGYVLARLAHADDMDVKVYHLGHLGKLPKAASIAAKACQAAGVDVQPFTADVELEADVVVDAILGIGLNGDVRGEALAAIEAVNASLSPVFSIDIPSGLDADTGDVCGDAVVAEATVTFIGLKQGLITGDALDYVGELIYDDLQVDEEVFAEVPITGYCLDFSDCQDALPQRHRSSHKGEFGHVVIVGGDLGMPGAVRMAGEAALRIGAGLVSIATRPEHITAIVASRPELMCYGIDKPAQLDKLLAKADVIVLGPGLNASPWSESLCTHVLKQKMPIVLDAGGLQWLSRNPCKRDNWVLTPHPGEAAQLLGLTSDDIQADRYQAAVDLQATYEGIVVLKGAGSIIQGPDNVPEVCCAGNPGMATAGMGDILSGVIAGLIAQELSTYEAARTGVCLHAAAGDLASEAGERGLLATDLFPHIRLLANADLDEESDLLEFDDLALLQHFADSLDDEK